MSTFLERKIVQAIVLADAFNEDFQPVTCGSPLALLPVVNIPILEYNLETLRRSGAEKVIIVCRDLRDRIVQYVNQRRVQETCVWSTGMEITIISNASCRSLGDALREVDARNIIRGDVILLGIDTITNVNLATLLKRHQRMVKKDPRACMLVAYKEGVQNLRLGNEVLVALDSSTGQLLHHQRLSVQGKESRIEIPLQVFLSESRPSVTLCHGLTDPQIAVCSSMVLPFFTDNFYMRTRDDFINEVLSNAEVLNCRIYVSKLGRGEYAMRINNWQSYHIVSLDVMNRWAYPLMAEGNRTTGNSRLDVTKSIGEQSFIGEGTHVDQSTIGRNSRIGKRSHIQNSFLFEGAVVDDDCILDHCIIGKDARVGANCRILAGSIIGKNVTIPMETTLNCTLVKPASEDIREPVDEDSLADDEIGEGELSQPMSIGPIPRAYSPSEYQESDDESSSDSQATSHDECSVFFSEVVESLQRGLAERIDVDNLILEINSSRFAYNVPMRTANFNIVKAIFHILTLQDSVEKQAMGTFDMIFKYFRPVYEHYIRGRDAAFDCLEAMEEMYHSHEIVHRKVVHLIYFFYNRDMIPGDVIVEWYEHLQNVELKQKLSELASWLSNPSSDDSDDSAV